MKVKLLKKLKNKFIIKKSNYSYYYVDGYVGVSDAKFKSLESAKAYRRKLILKYARTYYSDYSILSKKTWN